MSSASRAQMDDSLLQVSACEISATKFAVSTMISVIVDCVTIAPCTFELDIVAILVRASVTAATGWAD